MARKKHFYVVWHGRMAGIFSSWAECQQQIQGFSGAKYRGYETREAAERAYEQPYKAEKKPPSRPKNTPLFSREIEYKSICVDAACSGNPGLMEYRGVNTQTQKQLFLKGPYEQGTNNIGEFLALVHGLSFLKKQASHYALYSDSKIAISWVKNKKCKTNLNKTSRNARLFELITKAEMWLKNHSYNTKILKWETEVWGEIPADFGRK